MPIRVLPPDVAAKIAAGEVVERPASVVKELVENSLDAGATAITVETSQGGREMIRVTDDGSGIPADEAALAFQRHATSKISTAADLTRTGTMGFRGEALPTIATVARVVLVTRQPQDTVGTMVELLRGSIVTQRSQGAAPGTSVTVEHLFQDLPARRKYLKPPGAETARIHALVAQFALAHPQIRFTWLSEGRALLTTHGSGSLQEALTVVYGGNVARQLLQVAPVDGESYYRVDGFVSPPSLTRPNRGAFNFFVNHRRVYSRLLSSALEESYRGFLRERRYPLAVLNLSPPLAEVDVNVHPAKIEVRFLREGDVFTTLQRAVRRTLVASSPVPEARLSSSPVSTSPASFMAQQTWSQAFAPTPTHGKATTEPAAEMFQEPQRTSAMTMPLLRVLGQAGNVYIIAEGPDGVYLIDQHAAHERVLYEQVLQQVRERQPEVQGLLEPLVVELGPGQPQVALEQRELLSLYGLQVEPFGESSCLLRTVPALSRDAPPATLLVELVTLLAEERSPSDRDHSLAASISCHGAVCAGMTLEHQAMVALIRDLEATENPRTCPHGRPTIVHLSANHLEREFGRR